MPLKTMEFKFEAENAGPWYDRLEGKEKGKINASVVRLNSAIQNVRVNGLPEQYHKSAENVCKRTNADPSYLTDEAVFALDNMIAHAVEDQNIYGEVMAPVTTPQAGTKWFTKYYKTVQSDVDSVKEWPKPDKNFRNPNLFGVGIESDTVEGMGFSLGYQIPWTEIAESNGSIYSPEYYHALVAAERMGVIIDENGWLGGAGEHMSYDFGLKGLLNHASVQSHTASTLTTYGNIRVAFWNALGNLKLNFQAGEIVGIVSSGFASQMFRNRFGYTDVAEFNALRAEFSGMIPRLYVTDRIIGAVATTSNQVMALAKIGPTQCSRKLVYPLQSKPRMDKMYAEDVNEVLIHGDVLAQYENEVFHVTKAATLTTTSTGHIPNGRLW